MASRGSFSHRVRRRLRRHGLLLDRMTTFSVLLLAIGTVLLVVALLRFAAR